jgi:hypothetical protein
MLGTYSFIVSYTASSVIYRMITVAQNTLTSSDLIFLRCFKVVSSASLLSEAKVFLYGHIVDIRVLRYFTVL